MLKLAKAFIFTGLDEQFLSRQNAAAEGCVEVDVGDEIQAVKLTAVFNSLQALKEPMKISELDMPRVIEMLDMIEALPDQFSQRNALIPQLMKLLPDFECDNVPQFTMEEYKFQIMQIRVADREMKHRRAEIEAHSHLPKRLAAPN